MSIKFDEIEKAKHYNLHPSGVECKDIARYLGFDLGNACKYLWRMHEKHEDPLPDLKKALFYVQDHLDHALSGAGYRPAVLPQRDSKARTDYDYDVQQLIAKETNPTAIAFWCLVLPDPADIKKLQSAKLVLENHIVEAEQHGRLARSISVAKGSVR